MESSVRLLSAREAQNKAVVLDYYDRLCRQWNFAAASEHIGPDFRQHNPGMHDGAEGVKRWVDERPPFTSRMQTTIHRVLVDGDFVMLHNRVQVPGMPAMVIVDVFRLRDGKVVEHWDVMQPEPERALHGNGMV